MPGPQDGELSQLEGVDWTPVSEKLIPARLVGEVIGGVITLTLVSVPLILMLTGIWPDFPAWLAWALPLVELAAVIAMMLLVPRQVRAMGYAERQDDFLVKSGIFFRRVLAVPYGRLQYLDVREGPVQRHFGIRTLELQTASASTNATLPGIPVEDSERLRDQLMARGQARLAGL